MSGKKRADKNKRGTEQTVEAVEADNSVRNIDIDDRVRKEMQKLPEWVRDAFLLDLDLVAIGQAPLSDVDHLTTAGKGVIELKINGSPAYRCMYHMKTPGKVMVLHATVKTTNGSDKKLVELTKKRFKERR